MSASVSSAFWEVTAERAVEWAAKGRKPRHFFAHRIYHLPKCGPDGLRIATRMCGADDPAVMWEIVLFADPSLLAEFPVDVFFDDDVIWHQQQFGLPGQVATADIVVDGPTVYSMVHVSDVVQRISRRPELRSRIENRFKGWPHMLLNGVLSFARERGARRVRTPTAALALAHTDRARRVGPELFERVYDRVVTTLFAARRDGDWWDIDVRAASNQVVVPERRTEPLGRGKTICICHDVERGLGHVDVDAGFAQRAEETAPGDLEAMRRIEAELGVRATYCVVGSLLSEVRVGLEAEGHCLAFHSFDHRLDRDDQLPRCREVDYRLKGYRPPRSEITGELSDRNLLFHNFEWLASSRGALGITAPELRGGLVRLPIALDDFPMHSRGIPYEEWEHDALRHVAESDFAAIGLHDCYAPQWLSSYRGFLEKLRAMGELRTLDEVAAEITLSSAV